MFVAALLYADDMALIPSSLRGLQKLLTLCEQYRREWDICLNPKKSRNMYFGKRQDDLCSLRLNGIKIQWTDRWTYSGVNLVSSPNFICCVNEKIWKFYRAANNILRINGKSDDLLMLRLIETHCNPILAHAIEVISVMDRDARRQLRVTYNSVFRRVFNYRSWQSVSELQTALSRPTWEELVDKRINKFYHAIQNDTFLSVLLSA